MKPFAGYKVVTGYCFYFNQAIGYSSFKQFVQ